jgi:adenosylmethionine-8-amino-7-oxononanoate aminotransferase
LLIADEVMTGWGRTGTCLCLRTGRRGARHPLHVEGLDRRRPAACRDALHGRDFRCASVERPPEDIFHSSSYTANPIACAAAVANLAVWENEPVRERIRSLEVLQTENLVRFEADPRFGDVRQIGTIAALDLTVPAGGYLSEVGPKLRAFFRERKLLIRPLGNVIYLMPPYCVTATELERAYDAIDEAAAWFAAGRL